MDNRLFIASACTACLAVAFLGVLSDTFWPLHLSLPSLGHWLPTWILQAFVLQHSPLSTNQWNLLYHMGGNSPWIPKVSGVVEGGIDPPTNCTVEQVHMISRHAERYPTVAAGIRMLSLYERVRVANVTFKGDLAFINTWDFFIDEPAEDLESLVSTGPYAGTLEAFETGVKLRTRYKGLLDKTKTSGPISFWASDSERVIDTAKYFGAGFFGIDCTQEADLYIIPETPERGADTLTPGRTCYKYRNNIDRRGHDFGYRMMDIVRSTYEPAIARRLAKSNPEMIFAEAEIFTMHLLCGFETIANGSSPWCDIFTKEELEGFEYARDIIHYYRAGPGNPYSASMGWLWLNATANLLREGPSAGPLFFGFVHDGDIIPLLSALDLFPQHPDLPITHIQHDRTWRTSDVVPMGGRLIFERLSCSQPQECWSNAPFYPNHIYCEPKQYDTYVRINVNDGIVALPGCDSGPGSSCPLDQFLERVKKRGEAIETFGDICGLAEGAPDRITFLHQ